MVPDGRINSDWSEVCVSQMVMPELKRGEIATMDNSSSHKTVLRGERIEQAGATLLFLSPCISDFNPIEKAFARLKVMLRRAAARAVSGPSDLIGRLVDLFQPDESGHYFSSCGYEPESSLPPAFR